MKKMEDMSKEGGEEERRDEKKEKEQKREKRKHQNESSAGKTREGRLSISKSQEGEKGFLVKTITSSLPSYTEGGAGGI